MKIRFGPFTLDLDTRQLTQGKREIHLAPKAFELLATLVLDRPKVLSKAVLQQRLWPETFVAEANLSNLVAEIREALGDRARAPQFIRTAHGFGYAFCGDATTLSSATEPDRPWCWIEWGRRRFPLSEGEHVVGRDPDVEVRLDASTISRRHARLVVTPGGTALEDFGSKNGTFRGSERVTSPVQLADGDSIRFGSLLVTFHVRETLGPTETQVQPAPIVRGVPMPVATGTRVGPYEIVGWLGAGGMGEVYRARDPRLGREVAIKLIPETFAKDADRLHRFEQEARAAGQLNHPNILTVYDVGAHQGAPYVVSELLEGESLRSRLREAPLAPRKAIDYARQIAEGLAAAHDKGIVHRDLKPDNLFVTSDGRVKILDFGIAKLIQPADDDARHTGSLTETGAGTVMGTAGYMSPEQVRGETVDHRSDIFSFGAVLYEMVAGHPAFTRKTAADTMAAILKEEPPELSSPKLPPALVRIVTHSLEKAREARFQSAHDLAFDLGSLSGTSGTASPAVGGATPRRWRSALGIAVVLLSLLAAVASWLTRRTVPVDPPLANARFERFTDWEGKEGGAEISPDGRFVAFLADRAGEFDLWVSQVGTGRFVNLTSDLPPLLSPGPRPAEIGLFGRRSGASGASACIRE